MMLLIAYSGDELMIFILISATNSALRHGLRRHALNGVIPDGHYQHITCRILPFSMSGSFVQGIT